MRKLDIHHIDSQWFVYWTEMTNHGVYDRSLTFDNFGEVRNWVENKYKPDRAGWQAEGAARK